MINPLTPDLAVKVEHRPHEYPPFVASVWRGNTYVSGSTVNGETRDEAIAKAKAVYEVIAKAEPVEWVPFK